ncbi:DUF642 domain-containing protein [Gloeothece verrucosa]|uniref:DUF642 domain-containing protein n=1 Tax=Gloeothece verrucosa (strain PCC 7822) TaxID=497965 RepID=E0UFY1_GLOV7|nr:DUF642 domain-containing protein [Gloeothece verrucosa]ADN14364.1 hypothetical protein Cyan7822_2389 [Gloeothece verrucosa PCC 7822]
MKNNRIFKLVAVTSSLLALNVLFSSSQAQAANLVINSGFEQPAINPGTFIISNSVPGWTRSSISSGSGIELQNNVAGSPFEGNQFLELDSNGTTNIYQDITTSIGSIYNLSFAYSARPTVLNNSVDVYWGGNLVTKLNANGTLLSKTNWNVYNFSLQAKGTTTRLEFRSQGLQPSDGLGGYIDDVSVVPVSVPEPSTTLALAIGIAFASASKSKFFKKQDHDQT